MQVDFSQIRLLDLDGKDLEGSPPAHKIVANAIYRFTSVLDLVEVAREINQGKAVELSATDLSEIEKLTNNPQCGLSAFVKKAILDFVIQQKKGD